MPLFRLTQDFSITVTTHPVSQQENNIQGIHCLELLHQFEKCQYPLSICYMSGTMFAILYALLLSKHLGTYEVEIFTCICQWTGTDGREVISVQGHIPLRVNPVCEWGDAWWLLHWRCFDLSGSANWKTLIQYMKTKYQALYWLMLSFFKCKWLILMNWVILIRYPEM